MKITARRSSLVCSHCIGEIVHTSPSWSLRQNVARALDSFQSSTSTHLHTKVDKIEDRQDATSNNHNRTHSINWSHNFLASSGRTVQRFIIAICRLKSFSCVPSIRALKQKSRRDQSSIHRVHGYVVVVFIVRVTHICRTLIHAIYFAGVVCCVRESQARCVHRQHST